MTNNYFIAAISNLGDAFSLVGGIIMGFIFLAGVYKVFSGFNKWRSGDQDFVELLAGVFMALSPLIMYGVFKAIGLAGAAVDPSSMTALHEISFK